MIGDTLITKHFGTYVEERDTDLPAEELEGKIMVRYYGNSKIKSVVFAEDRGEHKPHLYDVPDFLDVYDRKNVAILGRPYKKEKKGKLFDKLVVISIKIVG